MKQGSTFSNQTERPSLTTAGTQKSLPKINLLPKVELILEIEELIPKNEEKRTFSEKLNKLFPEAGESIQQDHEILK